MRKELQAMMAGTEPCSCPRQNAAFAGAIHQHRPRRQLIEISLRRVRVLRKGIVMRLVAFCGIAANGAIIGVPWEDANVAGLVNATWQHHQQQLLQNPLASTEQHSFQDSRSLATYTSYSIREFALTFNAPESILESLSLQQVQKQLVEPLRWTVAEFVLESWNIQRARVSQQQQRASIPAIIWQFQRLHLDVSVRYVANSLPPHRRRLQQERMVLDQRQPEIVELDSILQLSVAAEHTLYAQFSGNALYLDPLDPTSKPSNEFMFELLGNWTMIGFTEDLAVLESRFRDSAVDILEKHSNLKFLSNLQGGDVIDSSSASQGAGVYNFGQSTSTSTVQRLLMTGLILVGCSTIVAACYLIKSGLITLLSCRSCSYPSSTAAVVPSASSCSTVPMMCFSQSPNSMDAGLFAFARRGHPSRPGVVVLPGRHAGDPMDAVGASDRYLQQHRPDLVQVIQRTALIVKSIFALNNRRSCNLQHNQSSETTGEKGSFEKVEHLHPLYHDDEMYLQQTDHLMDNKDQGLDGPSVVVQDNYDEYLAQLSADDLINMSSDSPGYTPISSWWNKITSTLRHPAHGGDGLVCDEDPNQYPFAFQDFPRHDGTPCLIYNEATNSCSTHESRRQTSVFVQHASTMSDRSRHVNAYPDHLPGSLYPQGIDDDDINRQIALHRDSSSFELDDSDDDDHCIVVARSVDFTGKLERLMALRRRHYEKERIMDRARESRRRERVLTEGRERELRLRRHEMELDLEQIEASLTPQALSRKSYNRNSNTDHERSISSKAKSHRVIWSDSEFFASVKGTATTANPSNASPLYEFGSIRQERDHLDHAKKRLVATAARPTAQPLSHSRRRCVLDDEIEGLPRPLPRPPPMPCRTSYTVAKVEPSPLSVVDFGHVEGGNVLCTGGTLTGDGCHGSRMDVMKHRSHRRSYSHGTNQLGSDAATTTALSSSSNHMEDVMTFGIAAYTNFV